MRWQGRRESDNVEDRRGQSGSPFGGGGGGGFRLPSGKGGIVLLIIVLVAGYYGVDLTGMLTGEPMPQQQTSTQRSISPKDDEAAKFTSVILATTEDTWGPIFEKMGRQYPQPKLVLYRGATRTGCGTGQSVMGPFYCPADSTVYIDLSFYDEMKNKLGADGDFAQGYVIAHEVGHHVQKLLGIEPKVRQQQQHATQAEANRLSVKMELQADCFAGVWGHNMQQQDILETGDLQEALNAAEAIGDDRLQQQSQGRVVPDSFTHGTSKQRYTWFKRGFDSGDPAQCNTFGSAVIADDGRAVSPRKWQGMDAGSPAGAARAMSGIKPRRLDAAAAGYSQALQEAGEAQGRGDALETASNAVSLAAIRRRRLAPSPMMELTSPRKWRGFSGDAGH